MSWHFGIVSCLAVLAACSGPAPSRPSEEPARVASGIDSQPRLFATARVFGGSPVSTSPTPDDRLPAYGAEYEGKVDASLLTEERESALPVHPTSSEETDLSNYQAGGWSFSYDTASTRRALFHYYMNYDRFTSGVLIVTLDTAAALDARPADSLAIAGLGSRERFAEHCRFGGYRPDDRIIGVVRDSTPERWMPARLAWLIDGRSARLRAMRPDSVACKLDEDPD